MHEHTKGGVLFRLHPTSKAHARTRPNSGQVIVGSRRVHPGTGPIRFWAAPYSLCVEGRVPGLCLCRGCASGAGVAALHRTRDTWSRACFWTRRNAVTWPKKPAAGSCLHSSRVALLASHPPTGASLSCSRQSANLIFNPMGFQHSDAPPPLPKPP